MRQIVEEDALPPLAAIGSDDHQVLVPPLGFAQDFVHDQAVAHLGTGVDAQTLQGLDILFQQCALGRRSLDQLLDIGP